MLSSPLSPLPPPPSPLSPTFPPTPASPAFSFSVTPRSPAFSFDSASPRSPTFSFNSASPTFNSTHNPAHNPTFNTHTHTHTHTPPNTHTPSPPTPTPYLRVRALTFGPGSMHPAAQATATPPATPSASVNGHGHPTAADGNTNGNGNANGNGNGNGHRTRTPPPPPSLSPKSPKRMRSVEKEKDRERERDKEGRESRERSVDGHASRSRERVPFPREDAPALPTSTSTSSLASTPPHASAQPVVSRAQSTSASGASTQGRSGGSAHGHESTKPTAAVNNATTAVSRSKSLPSPQVPPHPNTSPASPSNSHIPLAMQTRPREMSDPRAEQAAKSLLANAATRPLGSPPQHVQSHVVQAAHFPGPPQQPSPGSARAGSHSPTQYARQRTPERSTSISQRSTPERRPSESGSHLAREGSLRAMPEGAHVPREGSFRTPELALDVKRLLAKPASVSAGSVAHARAESTSAAEAPYLRRKRYDAAGNRVERVEEEGHKSRSEDGHLPPPPPLAPVRPHTGGGEDKEKKEKRPKNVLKRRPSNGRPMLSTAAPAPAAVTPAVARAGPPTLNLNLSLDPMYLPFTNGDASSPKGSPSEGSGSGSGSLTPAGAVVQAYKRGLDPNSPGASPLPSPSSVSSFRRKQSLPASAETASPPVTPYYTVFGSTSGRVVAVGGPDDAYDGGGSFISSSAFPSFDLSRPRSAKAKESSSAVGRTLTRKVSERWVRKREESEDDVRGRAISQEDRSKKGTRSRSRATGDDTHSPTQEPESSTWTKTPSPLAAGFTNEPRSRRSEPALGGGSKIWKLMKRISTGGLKEKYDRDPRSMPPVPPLPPVPPVPQLSKDHALEARSAMSTDGHSRDESGALSRFMQSRTSISGSHPSSGIPRPAARSLPMPPPIPASQPSRVSTTTRSSSPVSSSDVASSKYFHKTPGSARSSTSSYGEESAPPPMPVPIPNFIIGKHIVPPKDLYKLDLSELQSGSPDEKKVPPKPAAFFGVQHTRTHDDWTIVNTPAEEHPPSLPHPPRRLPLPTVRSPNRNSDTPSIPEFSTVAPINAFTSRRPKPGDKSRATGILSSLEPKPSRQSLALGDIPRQQISHADSVISNGSAARQRRIEQRSASLPRQEPLTFRDMSEKAAQALTEKEKADRWADLLQRSDRAGGTLHLGTSEQLPSDDMSLRYSASSAQLLNDL
ncbi:hypothetical protein B0H12DRAFT_1075470 [Mycena haematopus]|nr:hypothetical protein B0H12DRAFT_1075470 [Mycena haematopus]